MNEVHLGRRELDGVRWSVITKSKDVGGLGLRKLDVMSQVCILKIGWNLHAGNEDFCVVLSSGENTIGIARKIQLAKIQQTLVYGSALLIFGQ